MQNNYFKTKIINATAIVYNHYMKHYFKNQNNRKILSFQFDFNTDINNSCCEYKTLL